MLTKLYLRARLAFADRKGITGAEYAVLALGIVIVVAAAGTAFAEAIEVAFNRVTGVVGGGGGGGGAPAVPPDVPQIPRDPMATV